MNVVLIFLVKYQNAIRTLTCFYYMVISLTDLYLVENNLLDLYPTSQCTKSDTCIRSHRNLNEKHLPIEQICIDKLARIAFVILFFTHCYDKNHSVIFIRKKNPGMLYSNGVFSCGSVAIFNFLFKRTFDTSGRAGNIILTTLCSTFSVIKYYSLPDSINIQKLSRFW